MEKIHSDYYCRQIGSRIWQDELEEMLLSDEEFVEELDSFPNLLMSQTLKDKSIKERKDFLHENIIGNESRTFILNDLALKHINKKMDEESKHFLDYYWQTRLDNFILLNNRGKENKVFDEMKIEQPINLVQSLLLNDDNFINLFEKVFCKEGVVNKDNILKIVTSLLTSSPSYELAVEIFIFKYIANALESSKAEFIDDKEFLNIMSKISDVL